MAGLLGGMMLALVASVAWAAFGGGPERVGVARSEEAAAPEPVRRTAEQPATSAGSDGAPAERPGTESVDLARPADGGRAVAATEPSAREVAARQPAARRAVVTPVATRLSPRRPMAPADTTAAGHAGLAEALLAAGDTAAAIAAYNAFLARNTDPALERAAIATLRRLGGARD